MPIPWNATGRELAAQQIKVDTRPQPRPEEPTELDLQVGLVCPVAGALVFSGPRLHSTTPNTSGRTRTSIDFRSVHLDDMIAKRGTPNIDSACTGTSLRDFLRVRDFARLPDEVALTHDDGQPTSGELIRQSEPVNHIAR